MSKSVHVFFTDYKKILSNQKKKKKEFSYIRLIEIKSLCKEF